MSAIWTAGQPWPTMLPTEVDETGLIVVTHRGTLHRLWRADGGQISWTRQSNGRAPVTPFPPTAIGQPSPCGFAVEGRGLHDWWASSRTVYLGVGDSPSADLIDELIAIGTGPIVGHPSEPCPAVYCQLVDDTNRDAHLGTIFETIAMKPWQI